jgi:chemotaxis family two-component system response regulator Rcp1
MKKRTILLVEDNESDVELVRHFLSSGPGAPQLLVAGDGVEAMQMLRRETPHQDAPRPDLILLDLNLPRKDGKEVLADVKQDPELKNIPVVVLSTSSAELDVTRVYQLHANCYVTKPAYLDDFARTVRGIEEFWLSTARLPGDQRR